MNQALQDLGEYVAAAQGDSVLQFEVAHDQLNITARPESIVKLLTFLRDDQNTRFKLLMDVTAVDFPDRAPRFEVVYNLLSLTLNERVRVKVGVDEDATVQSVVAVYSSAIWFEREVWDMYGIMFVQHPDLRRILTDYGFEGHPLRKDFPLTGFVEVRYDDEQKRVVYEPVKLTQEFRRFDFTSPWEGMLQLPGDEKAESQEGAG